MDMFAMLLATRDKSKRHWNVVSCLQFYTAIK